MWNRLIKWFNKIALINVVKPRRALTAYLLALREADLDGNGELNIKELIAATKNKFKLLIFSEDLTDDEIYAVIREILKGDDTDDNNS